MRYVVVEPRAAQETIKRLRASGAVSEGDRVRRDGSRVLIPVAANVPEATFRGFEVVELAEDSSGLRRARVSNYRELMTMDPELKLKLPRAFDTVGDVAIIRLDAEIARHAPEIARAMTEWNPAIRRVAVDTGVEGPFRVRSIRLVMGDGLLTEHRENGLRLLVDLADVYFSPRLAGERMRIAGLVAPGESVLDMFAGVGPFAILVAKRQPDAQVVAVDANPAAVELLKENAVRNKVDVEAVFGKIEEVGPRLGRFDRLIMNLPRSGDEFLGLAFSMLKPRGGVVHHYAVMSEAEVAGRLALIDEAAREAGKTVDCTVRRLRNFAVRVWIHAIDIDVR